MTQAYQNQSNELIHRGVSCSGKCGRRSLCYVCTVCANAYFCNECVDDHWYATRHLIKRLLPSNNGLSIKQTHSPRQELISIPKPPWPSSPTHSHSSYTYSVPWSDSDFEPSTPRKRPFEPFRTEEYAAHLSKLPTPSSPLQLSSAKKNTTRSQTYAQMPAS